MAQKPTSKLGIDVPRTKLIAGEGEYPGANPEDPDEYRAEKVFWVPPTALLSYLQNSAKQPTIGKIIDDAMVAIERDNPRHRAGRAFWGIRVQSLLNAL